jgi:SAM-dependent methyltransferase
MPEGSSSFVSRWGKSSDSEWLTALLKACNAPCVEGVSFPTLPDAEVQRVIQGNSVEIAVRGSFAFYQSVRNAITAHDAPLDANGRLLDFGTGWGRIIRPFMREFPPENLYAVEPSADWCQTARRCNPYVSIIQSDLAPPLPFRENFFAYIIAYSIFTHLPEDLFDRWLVEFERILRPGGILAFTFLGDRTMQELERYPRPIPPTSEIHFWHRILLDAIEKTDPEGERYRADEFIFLPTGQTPMYGDTFMSPNLVRKKLRHWDILSIDSTSLAQDLCVIRRRS